MKTQVSIEFEIQMTQEETDEMISCYIPEINKYYLARTVDDVNSQANTLIKSFVNLCKNK
jgi:hypothetical protein